MKTAEEIVSMMEDEVRKYKERIKEAQDAYTKADEYEQSYISNDINYFEDKVEMIERQIALVRS